MKKVLIIIGFKQSTADPCLFIKKDEHGIIFLAIWVDDCYCLGNLKAIEEMLKKLKEHFNVKTEDNLSDYLSCEIVFNKEKTKALLGQPHLIKKMEKKFGDKVMEGQSYKTPGTPNQGLRQPEGDTGMVSNEDQKVYRSGVGMLLYLAKQTRPDIQNAVRELSKCMQKATPAAFKEMKRVIIHVLDTKEYGLKMEPVYESLKNWILLIYSDSDWAGDKDTRKSVTEFIIYLMNCPIIWRSKGQRAVALSSSEAEFYALSEAVKELKFLIHLLKTMGIPVELPVIIRVDNIGAIFMAENASTSERTKHIDLRTSFVREMIVDKEVKIIFVKSEENKSDGLTKNLGSDLHNKHRATYVDKRNYWEEKKEEKDEKTDSE